MKKNPFINSLTFKLRKAFDLYLVFVNKIDLLSYK